MALQQEVFEVGVPVESLAAASELGGENEPLVSAAVEFLTKLFASLPSVPREKADAIIKGVPELAEMHKPETAYEGKLKEGVVLITDPKAFKQGLKVAPDPTPVVQWGDLPTPKL